MIVNAADQIGEPRFSIDAIEAASLDESEEDRGPVSAGVGTEERPVSAPERERTDSALSRIVGHLQAPVLGEAAERLPAVEAVAYRLGKLALAADPTEACLQVSFEVHEQGRAARLAHGTPVFSALAIDLPLDCEDGADLFQRLKRDR